MIPPEAPNGIVSPLQIATSAPANAGGRSLTAMVIESVFVHVLLSLTDKMYWVVVTGEANGSAISGSFKVALGVQE